MKMPTKELVKLVEETKDQFKTNELSMCSIEEVLIDYGFQGLIVRKNEKSDPIMKFDQRFKF